MPTRVVDVIYSQVSVFTASEPDFPLWTDEHVAQGVAWRHGHASFGIPDHDGPCLLDWGLTDSAPELGPDMERLLVVPLEVETTGAIIATVNEDIDAGIGGGGYNVWFGLTPKVTYGDRVLAYRILIRFEPTATPRFQILKPGAEMDRATISLRDAEPG